MRVPCKLHTKGVGIVGKSGIVPNQINRSTRSEAFRSPFLLGRGITWNRIRSVRFVWGLCNQNLQISWFNGGLFGRTITSPLYPLVPRDRFPPSSESPRRHRTNQRFRQEFGLPNFGLWGSWASSTVPFGLTHQASDRSMHSDWTFCLPSTVSVSSPIILPSS